MVPIWRLILPRGSITVWAEMPECCDPSLIVALIRQAGGPYDDDWGPRAHRHASRTRNHGPTYRSLPVMLDTECFR